MKKKIIMIAYKILYNVVKFIHFNILNKYQAHVQFYKN